MNNSNDTTLVNDTAALREALERLLRFLQWMYAQEGRSADIGRDRLSDEIDIAISVLAAPARNCDVGTADEQAERFMHYCDNGVCNRRGIDCGCGYEELFRHKCALKWAQMPYKEGEGAE